MPFEGGQSAADKPFEGLSKAVCERISHSRADNVNGYRTDEDICEQMAQPFERLTIFCERMAQPLV